MKKRLFLFASYDKYKIIDNALVYYVQALSKLGDVIFVMDSDAPDNEIQKISKYCLYIDAHNHGEYDFGSYKRAYVYAYNNDILSNYDAVYMVNDSVYGPLYELAPYLERMESLSNDAWGIVCNPHKSHPHIQSWFIGMNKTVFLSDWFDKFIRSVTKLSDKGMITKLYEQGFTKNLIEHKIPWHCLYDAPGRSVYNNVKKLYICGMPFMKKNAFPRNHGALGRQIQYVLGRVSPALHDAILQDAKRIYGDEYIHWLLTKNPIKIVYRNLRHAAHKLFIEGI